MKFIFVINNLKGNDGYSTYSNNLIEPLLENGHEVLTVTSDTTESNIKQVAIFDSNIYKYFYNIINIYRTARHLQKIIDKENPNVLHFVVEAYQQTLLFLILPKKTKVVMTVHGTYSHLPSLCKGLTKYLCSIIYYFAHKKIDLVISVSNFTKDKYLERNKKLSRPVIVLHNSTNHSYTKPTLKYEPYQAITVGEVKKRKGIFESIKALSVWSNENKIKVIYNVVGFMPKKNNYTECVSKLAAELSNTNFSIIFHGKISHVEKEVLFKKSSVYLHLEPTNQGNFEGFGIGIIDAAAFGIPALVSKGTATEEAVLDSLTGYALDVTNLRETSIKLSAILIENEITQAEIEQWANTHQPSETIKKYLQIIHE